MHVAIDDSIFPLMRQAQSLLVTALSVIDRPEAMASLHLHTHTSAGCSSLCIPNAWQTAKLANPRSTMLCEMRHVQCDPAVAGHAVQHLVIFCDVCRAMATTAATQEQRQPTHPQLRLPMGKAPTVLQAATGPAL